MSCKETRLMTHAYVDGELDVLTTARIESHVRTCTICQQKLRELSELRAGIKTSATYFRAPAGLQKHIQNELRKPNKKAWQIGLRDWRWSSFGPLIAAILFFSVSLVLVMKTTPMEDLFVREILSSHVRSLMEEHLTDVRSSDQHTVKPWFIGRLDYSPPVHDLALQGFTLVGARLDYLDNRQVAALVYKVRQHFINLFIWPISENSEIDIGQFRMQGYEIFTWTQNGMIYCAVSDVNENDLNQFTHLIRSKVVMHQAQ